MEQAKEIKALEKCIRTTEIFQNVLIKKEIDEKVDTYKKKQLRSKYMKLMN